MRQAGAAIFIQTTCKIHTKVQNPKPIKRLCTIHSVLVYSIPNYYLQTTITIIYTLLDSL